MINLTNFDALAYARFRWHGVPDQIGDVERILTWWDGHAVLTDDRRLLPVQAQTDVLEPWRPLKLYPIGGSPSDSALYPWSRLISVAPARRLITTLQQTLAALDESQVKLAILARMTRAYKTSSKSAGDVGQLVDAVYPGAMPVLTVDRTFSPDDIITIGDGDTHAQGVSEMHQVALARCCQALGIHAEAVINAERLITDEADATRDLVDVVREQEIAEREKLASWTGWRLEVLI